MENIHTKPSPVAVVNKLTGDRRPVAVQSAAARRARRKLVENVNITPIMAEPPRASPETHSLVAVKIISAVKIILVVDFGVIIVTKECKKLW